MLGVLEAWKKHKLALRYAAGVGIASGVWYHVLDGSNETMVHEVYMTQRFYKHNLRDFSR